MSLRVTMRKQMIYAADQPTPSIHRYGDRWVLQEESKLDKWKNFQVVLVLPDKLLDWKQEV